MENTEQADAQLTTQGDELKTKSSEWTQPGVIDATYSFDFPGTTAYGNYDDGKPLPDNIARIPMDGSIRIVRKLRIPFREIVSIENVYGNTWKPRMSGYAIPADLLPTLQVALSKARETRVVKLPRPHSDILLCISEASRAAHRERDAAQAAYLSGRHTLAGNAKRRKEAWYALKERGIVHCHRTGLLRYSGVTPQGMAVYEYERNGVARCFHSILHPGGAERQVIANHPEILFVEAKEKTKGLSLQRVEVTLDNLPQWVEMRDGRLEYPGYERSARPSIAKPPIVCYECGEVGHIARHCDMGMAG